jgi:hypothetical protein
VKEQRKAQRFDLRLPFELIRGGPVQGAQLGETKNISSGGVLLTSTNDLEPGESVEYVITLPSASEVDRVRIRCLGKVVRCGEFELAATLERYEFVRKDPGPKNGHTVSEPRS